MKFQTRLARLGVVLLATTLLATTAVGKKDRFNFKFGLMTPSPSGLSVVYLETKEIEKHADPADMHGFTIKRKGGAQFFLYYIIRFPVPLTNLPEGIEEYYTVLDGGRALQSKEELVWEKSHSFVFDESDPIGTYQLEVYTDGELYRKIDYNVSPVPNYKR